MLRDYLLAFTQQCMYLPQLLFDNIIKFFSVQNRICIIIKNIGTISVMHVPVK